MVARGGEDSVASITPHMNSARGSAPAAAAAAFVFRKMGVLLSSLWLCVTVSVLFLAKFLAARVQRIRAEGGGGGERVGEKGVSPEKEEFPSLSAEGSSFFQQIFHDENREWREKGEPVGRIVQEEFSSLEFKLSRQILDDMITKDDDHVANATSTNVNNYRFVLEKGSVRIIQVPEPKTFSIHELYVEDGRRNEDARPNDPELLDRELKDRFSSVKSLDQQIQHHFDAEEVVSPESKAPGIRSSYLDGHQYEDARPNDPELLDRELKGRFSSVKYSEQQVQHHSDEEDVVLPESKTFSIPASYVDGHQYEDARPNDLELLDRELKERFSSVKCFDQQIQHSLDEKEVVPEDSKPFSIHQSYVDTHQYEDAQPYEPELLDRELDDGFSSVKYSDQQIQHNSDEGEVVLEHGATESVKQHRSLEKSESVGSNQEVKSSDEDEIRERTTESTPPKVLLQDGEAIASDGMGTTPRELESSEAFDLDSISISSSDGYSVRDLDADYDSDDLISDRDFSFSGSEDLDSKRELEGFGKELDELLASDEQSTSTEKRMDLDAGFKLDELLSDDDGGDGGDDDGVDSVDFTDHFDKQLDESFVLESQEQVEKLVEEITNKAAAVTKKIRLEHLEFESQFFNEDKSGIHSREPSFPGSLDFDKEFIELGTEKVSILMNQNRNLASTKQNFSDKSTLQSVEKGEAELYKEDSHVEGYDYSDKTDFKKHEDLNEEEDDELESLWEHQDLIEQLKLELKKAKSIGLPTIQEDSENFKLMEDLKPWKIDVESPHKDPMDELNKLYKSYKEKMRKLDILNYQKMYSIGCLKLKDPLKSIGNHKPAIASMFSENFWPCRRRKSEDDPSQTFIKELQSDLENVYVGQMCLSWEFLWWQYEKAVELFESDRYSSQRYSQVAVEFQQLKVMMQRFLEDQPFQGPRLTYYVKNRCLHRGLLQVPMVRGDSAKDNKAEASQPSHAVTSEDLQCMMQKIIELFLQFVKSDKDVDAPSVMKGLGFIRTHVELQDPSDSELLENIRESLQKKEKKLQDLLKVGNCLVKKFKKPQQGRSSMDMFYSQVDVKLISRALTMSRISTDQLLWCHKKLSKINFENRRLHREPAFLLFPC